METVKKYNKFTFKMNIETGKYASFHPKSCQIKLNKKECGLIVEDSHFSKTNDGFCVSIYFSKKREITPDNPAPFQNVRIKKRFHNINDAKIYLNENYKKIQSEINIFCMD